MVTLAELLTKTRAKISQMTSGEVGRGPLLEVLEDMIGLIGTTSGGSSPVDPNVDAPFGILGPFTAAQSLTEATNNKLLLMQASSPINIPLPADKPRGFRVRFMQYGAGQLTFSTLQGATLRGASTSPYQYGIVEMMVINNGNGGQAEWVGVIDTAAEVIPDTAPTQLSLSVSSIPDNAQVGSIIAIITANGYPAPTFSITADPDGKFLISGNQLILEDTVDAGTATEHDVTLRATNTAGFFETTLTLSVVDIDTESPTVTTATAFSTPENAPWSTVLNANEPVSWSKLNTLDGALFTLSGNTLSMVARDFENPLDSGANNTYQCTVRATDPSGNFTDHTITLTITDVVETSSSKAFLWLDDNETDPDGLLNIGACLYLDKQDRIDLVGIGLAPLYNTVPPAIQAILDAYGRGSIPIGFSQRTGTGFGDILAASTRDKFGVPGETGSAARYTTYVRLLRQMVRDYPGLRIGSGGYCKGLVEFLNSGPDDIDNRTGVQLIQQQAPKLFIGLGMRPAGYSTTVPNWTNGPIENNTALDLANARTFVANWPGPISFFSYPNFTGNTGNGGDFGTVIPALKIRAANDAEIDPLAHMFRRGSTPISNGTVLLDSNGERWAGDMPIIQAALDDIEGVPVANQVFTNPGTFSLNTSGNSSWSVGGGGQHRIMTVTTPVATLKSRWQGWLDALLPPTSVNYCKRSKDLTFFSPDPAFPNAVIGQNNNTNPDGTLTADSLTGVGYNGILALKDAVPNHQYLVRAKIKKEVGATRFPCISIQWRNGTSPLKEIGMIVNNNSDQGTTFGFTGAISGQTAPAAPVMTITTPANTPERPNNEDYWLVTIAGPCPSNCNAMAVFLQPGSGNNPSGTTRSGTGASTTKVITDVQIEPVAVSAGELPSDGDCTYAVAV